MALTKVSSGGIEDGSIINADLHSAANIAGSKLADNSISLAKLLHGDSNNNGKFLRANNGADPSYETIDLTALSASNLTSGTVPDARFPATLPAASAANLTNIPAANITGALPAIDGSNLTGLAAFPSGTKMLFAQSSAPTGWTHDTNYNDRALRLVSDSSGGSTGGSNTWSSVLNSSVSTSGGSVSNHTLTTSQMPSHNHSMTQRNIGAGCGSNIPQTGVPGTFGCGTNSTSFSTNNTGSGNAHNHGFSNPSFNLNLRYLNVIVATKD